VIEGFLFLKFSLFIFFFLFFFFFFSFHFFHFFHFSHFFFLFPSLTSNRCLSRLVPYLGNDDISNEIAVDVVNEILEIFSEVRILSFLICYFLLFLTLPSSLFLVFSHSTQQVGLTRLDSPPLDLTKVGIFKPVTDLLGSLSNSPNANELLVALLRFLAAAVTVDRYLPLLDCNRM
jgi:hypothetical protein